MITWMLTMVLLVSEILPSFVVVFSYLVLKGSSKQELDSIDEMRESLTSIDLAKDAKGSQDESTEYMIAEKAPRINKSSMVKEAPQESKASKYTVNLSSKGDSLDSNEESAQAHEYDSERGTLKNERGDESDVFNKSSKNQNQGRHLLALTNLSLLIFTFR
jgi:hypothetical protein